MTTISKPQTQKATRPASRWRNRWRALRVFVHSDAPIIRHDGEEFWGTVVWPSRDTAETAARQREAEWPKHIKYLGAFPVDA